MAENFAVITCNALTTQKSPPMVEQNPWRALLLLYAIYLLQTVFSHLCSVINITLTKQ